MQGLSNFGELVVLALLPKLRRGFDFGLLSCLRAGIIGGRPVPIGRVIAFFLLLLVSRVRVLDVSFSISLCY